MSPLGAGGMGEVYGARDSRLGREVAIKVLPAALSSDAERLKRFEKEARSASALNHPNIVTVYDVGSQEGVSYLAMELVSGETLRTLLAGGAMPIKKLLAIAPQIAEGLAKAHEAGIVHRDLKPENVMVTKDGRVKILDFGLAKLTSTMSGSGSHEGSQLPTMTGTTPGVVVGTVGYMSPEQASGQAVDFRSDQFSFGSILYEMATGKRAFQRKTAVDTLGAILNEEPAPIGASTPQTPAPLRWIVERCLTKEPQGRYASTQDLARDLSALRDHLSEASLSGAAATAMGPRPRWRLALPALAVALILATFLADRWLVSRGKGTEPPSFRRLTFGRGSLLNARFTPDGRTVIYAAAWDGEPAEIFAVRTDSVEPRPIGLSAADVMSVSSKGELAVLLHKKDVLEPWGTGTLARVPIGGGTPRELLEDVFRADWAPNGEDLAVLRLMPGGKYQLQYPIGRILAEADDFGSSLRVSPKGDLVACSEGETISTFDRLGKRHIVLNGWHADGLAWSPAGDEILFAGGGSDSSYALRAVSLSGRLRTLVPAPGPLNLGLHDIASDGRLLVEHSEMRGGIVCLAPGENRERELGRLGFSFPTFLSADGKLLLFFEGTEGGGAKGRIYLRKTDGSPAVRIGDGQALGLSSDGRWVLSMVPGPPRQLVMIPTGPGAARRIPVEGFEPTGGALLPNGKGFLVRADRNGVAVLLVVGPDGGKPEVVRAEGLTDRDVVVSPDGERFAYVTNGGELKIARFPGKDAARAPGTPLEANDDLIQWSADGRFLYVWRSGEVPAPVDRIDLTSGKREPWKKLMPANPAGVAHVENLTVTPDGQSYAYFYNRQIADDLYVVERVN
ncbi:MAG TPA: protein kinase [Thermoanaerobaculia bacterium]|nr:protein kinase [Thermoanaerobaculia bacterium]